MIEFVDKKSNKIILNMGPHHPSTHGVLRFVLETDGELILGCRAVVGYLHRSIEKCAEDVTYNGFMPYTDRVDYLSAMLANHGYAMAVEKLLGIEVPKRAEYLRVIADELNRIISHLLMLGVMAMDIGAVTPFVLGLKEREKVNDLMEWLCGQRLTYNYMRIGGVARDIPDGWKDACLKFLDSFEPFIDEFNDLITYNKIYIERLKDVVVITDKEALDFGLVGPNLRASGVDWDLRRDMPYSIYPELDFNVVVGKGEMGTVGDSFDRFVVRIGEMRESVKMIRQCLQNLPDGPIMAKLPRKLKVDRMTYTAVESSRGELGYFVVGDGSETPFRVKIRTGSFSAMHAIEKKAKGILIADMITLIASMDVVAPEVDR